MHIDGAIRSDEQTQSRGADSPNKQDLLSEALSRKEVEVVAQGINGNLVSSRPDSQHTNQKQSADQSYLRVRKRPKGFELGFG